MGYIENVFGIIIGENHAITLLQLLTLVATKVKFIVSAKEIEYTYTKNSFQKIFVKNKLKKFLYVLGPNTDSHIIKIYLHSDVRVIRDNKKLKKLSYKEDDIDDFISETFTFKDEYSHLALRPYICCSAITLLDSHCGNRQYITDAQYLNLLILKNKLQKEGRLNESYARIGMVRNCCS
jgi:hypothetical protein